MELPDGFVFTFEYDIRWGTMSIDITGDKSELVKCKHCKHCEYDAKIGLLCSAWGYCSTESDGWCYKCERSGTDEGMD